MSNVGSNTASEDAETAFQISKVRKANDDLQIAKNIHQSVTKSVESKGIDLKAANEAVKIAKAGKVKEFIAYTAAVTKYARLLGNGVTEDQIDILDVIPSRQPLDEASYEAGFMAGLMGDGEGKNPHAPDTDAGQKFIQGLNAGASERNKKVQQESQNDSADPIRAGEDIDEVPEPDESPEFPEDDENDENAVVDESDET